MNMMFEPDFGVSNFETTCDLRYPQEFWLNGLIDLVQINGHSRFFFFRFNHRVSGLNTLSMIKLYRPYCDVNGMMIDRGN